MGPSSLSHPDDEILRAYGLAQLDDRASGSVNRHLRSCESCRGRMATLGASGFPDRARDAQPGKTASIELKREIGSNFPEPNWTWPAELNALPDHEIIRRLDKGGMGAVYLARHKILKRLEALKVVQQHLTDRPQYVARFHREIEAAGRLDHPNVVPAYGAMKTASGLVFVMKYVEGEDLRQLVKRAGPVPIAEACGYAVQVASGLQHAHEKNIVHRDIKPANLILAGCSVMILDFGLAKFVREVEGETDVTVSQQTIGTPDYIAPEQTLDPRKADIRADIYCLGCTLYFLISGEVPFRAPSLPELYEAHRKKRARPLNVARPGVSTELSRVVAKMMAKDPAARYQTPADVVDALTPFAATGALPAQVRPTLTSRASTTDEYPRDESKHSARPVISTTKAAESSSWGTPPEPTENSRPIKISLAKLRAPGGRAGVALALVLLAGLVFALVYLYGGEDHSDEHPGVAAKSAAERSFHFKSRVRVKTDTQGFPDAVSPSRGFLGISAGRTGRVTQLYNGSSRCQVMLDPPDSIEVWIIDSALEPE